MGHEAALREAQDNGILADIRYLFRIISGLWQFKWQIRGYYVTDLNGAIKLEALEHLGNKGDL